MATTSQNKVVREITFVAATTAAQTLPHDILAAKVLGVTQVVSGTPTALTVVDTAPSSSSEIEFTGTVETPSGALTLDAAAAADTTLAVQYQLPGDVVSDQ